MRHAFGLVGSAAVAVVGAVGVLLFGLIGRQYGGPCTTDAACTTPGLTCFCSAARSWSSTVRWRSR